MNPAVAKTVPVCAGATESSKHIATPHSKKHLDNGDVEMVGGAPAHANGMGCVAVAFDPPHPSGKPHVTFLLYISLKTLVPGIKQKPQKCFLKS